MCVDVHVSLQMYIHLCTVFFYAHRTLRIVYTCVYIYICLEKSYMFT